MSSYHETLSTIHAILTDSNAFRGGQPQWKTMDDFDRYFTLKGFRLVAAERMGPSNQTNGQQLIYQGPNNVIIKIKTRGYNDNGPPQRVGVATMSIEATDGKGTGWDNAIFKVDGKGKVLAKSITAINEEVVRLPPEHPARKTGAEWGVKNPRDGSVRAFTKFEVIQGGGGQSNPTPVNKQAWADATHMNLPKEFSPRGADDLASRINGRTPKPTPTHIATVPPRVVPPTPPARPNPPRSSNTSSGTPNNRNAYTGDKIKPVGQFGPNPTPRTDALKLALKGVDWIIQEINDSIQRKRIEEEMRRIGPTIEQTLDANPSLGVLIVVVFSKRNKVGAEHETPLEHTKGFQYITYEYGRTEEEARQKMARTPQMRPAGQGEYVSERKWIPPSQAPSVQDLPTPFAKSALATFVPGLEELVSVKFSHASGFDDKMKSRIPVGTGARFIILFPPNDVSYFWNGSWRKENLEVALVKPAEIVDHEQSTYYVPTVQLDSMFNPYDATAAFVYPADDYTKQLFDRKGRIDDGGLLSNYSMNLVRFVKPHKIRLLKDFSQVQF